MELIDSADIFARIGTDLVKLVILAFFLERALALVFELKWYGLVFGEWKIKPLLAFALAAFVCFYYDFDVVATLLEPQAVTLTGILVTAAIVAGGSKVALQLVQEIWGFNPAARETRKIQHKERLLQAEARRDGLPRSGRRLSETSNPAAYSGQAGTNTP